MKIYNYTNNKRELFIVNNYENGSTNIFDIYMNPSAKKQYIAREIQFEAQKYGSTAYFWGGNTFSFSAGYIVDIPIKDKVLPCLIYITKLHQRLIPLEDYTREEYKQASIVYDHYEYIKDEQSFNTTVDNILNVHREVFTSFFIKRAPDGKEYIQYFSPLRIAQANKIRQSEDYYKKAKFLYDVNEYNKKYSLYISNVINRCRDRAFEKTGENTYRLTYQQDYSRPENITKWENDIDDIYNEIIDMILTGQYEYEKEHELLERERYL